jgi:hypothetical protein
MKKMLIIALALSSYGVQAQTWGREFGIGYVNANPVGGMGEIIQRGHGVALNYAFVNPNQRFAFGLDMAYAQYGREKSTQEYTFDDGSVVPMDIVVSNYFVNVMAYTRWYLTPGGAVRPFLIGKLGYALFSTDLNIYDPDEADHCEPVDHDVLHKDGTMIGVIGAGAKFDLGKIFKSWTPDMFYIDCSINLTQGGQVRYMNADAPRNHPPANDVDHVMAEFINTQTQVRHKHHVGYVYENPVQMTELHFGFSMNISR